MVVDTHLYDILGVDPDVSERELKKAFMKKAREVHPDKNQDDPDATEKFQQVNEAYEILKDQQKRELYDKYGAEGLKEGAGDDVGDILSHLFGFDLGGGGGQQSKPRTRNITENVEVSLDDLYNGAEKKVTITRHVACPECNATGAKPGAKVKKCEQCDGQGKVIMLQGMFQQIAPCPACHGEGQIVDEKDKCKHCKGEQLIEDEKEFDVHIERGMEDGEKIVFQGASSEVPGADPGDVIIIVNELPHSEFKRRHNELLIKKHISLSEALFGARFVITHLDGRVLVVETNPKQVIEPNTIQVIEKEGMPIRGDSFTHGNLYIEYIIDFPTHDVLTRDFRHALCKIVPHRDGAKGINLEDPNVTQVTPTEAHINDFDNAQRSKRQGRNEAYRSEDEDDDDYSGDGEEGVGCAPM